LGKRGEGSSNLLGEHSTGGQLGKWGIRAKAGKVSGEMHIEKEKNINGMTSCPPEIDKHKNMKEGKDN